MPRNSIVLTLFALLFHVQVGVSPAQESPSQPRFPAVNHAEAWKRMPREQPPLPVWARVLVEPLPKATVALLELDYLHRAHNPLGPVLAGKLRWIAADTIGCEYARRYAESDLRRSGLSDDDLRRLAGDRRESSESDRAVLDFARLMTRAAHEVTDDQVAALIQQLGPETLVGIVHTLAFANFQNRLFLALGAQVEPDGPLPPIDPQVDPEQQEEIQVPARRPWEELPSAEVAPGHAVRLDWGQWDSGALERALERQKNRGSRIPLPPPERLADLPPAERERTSRIVWSHVSMGYQPRLTKGWFHLMQMFGEESDFDRVFSNSVFWIVTRGNECFY
jgi:alkylhydroperoxidase family enzyme